MCIGFRWPPHPLWHCQRDQPRVRDGRLLLQLQDHQPVRPCQGTDERVRSCQNKYGKGTVERVGPWQGAVEGVRLCQVSAERERPCLNEYGRGTIEIVP